MIRGRLVIRWLALLLAITLSAGACGSALSEPGGPGARDVDVHYRARVDGLAVGVERVRLEPAQVMVDLSVHNTGEARYALLMGGCGPSQGRATTAGSWVELYYDLQPNDGFTGTLEPGETVRGRLVLKVRGPEPLDPSAVTELKLHPGYVYNEMTGALHLLEANLPLAGGDRL